MGERGRDVDPQASIHGQQTGVEGDIVRGAGGQAIAGIEAFGRGAVLPWLDMTGEEHASGPEGPRAQTAEDALIAAVAQHVLGKHVLPDAGRSQENPLGFPDLPLRPFAVPHVASELLPQACFQHGAVQLLLAQQGQLAAVLQPEEVGQPVRSDALQASSLEKYPVGARESPGIVPQDGSGQGIPSSSVRPGTIQVGHLCQDAGRPPGEQARERRNGFRRLVSGRPAEPPVIDHERGRQTEQRLNRQERDLPATRDGTALQKSLELLPRLADRQLKVIGEGGHAVRLLLAASPAAYCRLSHQPLLAAGNRCRSRGRSPGRSRGPRGRGGTPRYRRSPH